MSKRRKTMWFTREQTGRLLWSGYVFGLLTGLAAGLVTGFGYAGGFAL